MTDLEDESFLSRQHVMFAYRCARFLPTPYQPEDSNRMALAYFCLSSLALLPGSAVSSASPVGQSALDAMLKPQQRQGFIDWVYEQQAPGGGFRGSNSMTGTGKGKGAAAVIPGEIPLSSTEEEEFARLMAFDDQDEDEDRPPDAPQAEEQVLSPAHIVQSYTALLILGLLSDDYSRLDREGLLRFVARCQCPDGSFSLFPGAPEEPDPRSVFPAFAISSMLNDWSACDVDRALSFLVTCQNPSGGFATRPGLEAQGGTTYCSIAAFSLSSRMSTLPNPEETLRWLVSRQVPPPPPPPPSDSDSESESEPKATPAPSKPMAGFQGRIGKTTDACYSFWCSAALRLLRPDLDLLDPELDRNWLHSCQHPTYGGIAREPGASPDIYHTYLSLAALSLGGQPGLFPLEPAWNVPQAVADRIKRSLARSTA
ncbi:hypothetical protein RQP46_008607 [Phenoliferia psychrophenolica]